MLDYATLTSVIGSGNGYEGKPIESLMKDSKFLASQNLYKAATDVYTQAITQLKSTRGASERQNAMEKLLRAYIFMQETKDPESPKYNKNTLRITKAYQLSRHQSRLKEAEKIFSSDIGTYLKAKESLHLNDDFGHNLLNHTTSVEVILNKLNVGKKEWTQVKHALAHGNNTDAKGHWNNLLSLVRAKCPHLNLPGSKATEQFLLGTSSVNAFIKSDPENNLQKVSVGKYDTEEVPQPTKKDLKDIMTLSISSAPIPPPRKSLEKQKLYHDAQALIIFETIINHLEQTQTVQELRNALAVHPDLKKLCKRLDIPTQGIKKHPEKAMEAASKVVNTWIDNQLGTFLSGLSIEQTKTFGENFNSPTTTEQLLHGMIEANLDKTEPLKVLQEERLIQKLFNLDSKDKRFSTDELVHSISTHFESKPYDAEAAAISLHNFEDALLNPPPPPHDWKKDITDLRLHYISKNAEATDAKRQEIADRLYALSIDAKNELDSIILLDLLSIAPAELVHFDEVFLQKIPFFYLLELDQTALTNLSPQKKMILMNRLYDEEISFISKEMNRLVFSALLLTLPASEFHLLKKEHWNFVHNDVWLNASKEKPGFSPEQYLKIPPKRLTLDNMLILLEQLRLHTPESTQRIAYVLKTIFEKNSKAVPADLLEKVPFKTFSLENLLQLDELLTAVTPQPTQRLAEIKYALIEKGASILPRMIQGDSINAGAFLFYLRLTSIYLESIELSQNTHPASQLLLADLQIEHAFKDVKLNPDQQKSVHSMAQKIYLQRDELSQKFPHLDLSHFTGIIDSLPLPREKGKDNPNLA